MASKHNVGASSKSRKTLQKSDNIKLTRIAVSNEGSTEDLLNKNSKKNVSLEDKNMVNSESKAKLEE